jgi:hypothetical protein
MKKVSGVNDILNSLSKIDEAVMKPQQLNHQRAMAFKAYTLFQVKTDGLGLKPIKNATQVIQGGYHNPLYNRGTLLNQMNIKDMENESQAGYFESDGSRPAGGKLTWFKIALIQTIGYRIPLQGEKGLRVRKFLAVFGIFPKKSRQFLHVTPRPFLINASWRYQTKGKDEKLVDNYFNKLWRTI